MRVRKKNRAAVAAVELAVFLPFLLFIFCVTVDYGRIFYITQVVENCARNGALYASNASGNTTWEAGTNDCTTVQAATKADGSDLSPPLADSDITVAKQNDADGNASVRVTVTYKFQALTGFPGIPRTVDISRTVQMRVSPSQPDP